MRGHFFFSTVFIAVGLAGCTQTTGVAPATPAATAAARSTSTSEPAKATRVITKGMEGDEILRRIGKPTEIRPMESPSGHAEVWVYRRPAGTESGLTATTVVQTPVADPLTGVQFTVPEPSYSQETRELIETTNLLMFDGKLTEWTRTVEAKRSFH